LDKIEKEIKKIKDGYEDKLFYFKSKKNPINSHTDHSRKHQVDYKMEREKLEYVSNKI